MATTFAYTIDFGYVNNSTFCIVFEVIVGTYNFDSWQKKMQIYSHLNNLGKQYRRVLSTILGLDINPYRLDIQLKNTFFCLSKEIQHNVTFISI